MKISKNTLLSLALISILHFVSDSIRDWNFVDWFMWTGGLVSLWFYGRSKNEN